MTCDEFKRIANNLLTATKKERDESLIHHGTCDACQEYIDTITRNLNLTPEEKRLAKLGVEALDIIDGRTNVVEKHYTGLVAWYMFENPANPRIANMGACESDDLNEVAKTVPGGMVLVSIPMCEPTQKSVAHTAAIIHEWLADAGLAGVEIDAGRRAIADLMRSKANEVWKLVRDVAKLRNVTKNRIDDNSIAR